VAWQRAQAAAEDAAAREKLVEAGMTFTPIPDEVRSELRSLTAPVIEDLKSRIDPAIIDAVLAEVSG